jgi:hypothetical protein
VLRGFERHVEQLLVAKPLDHFYGSLERHACAKLLVTECRLRVHVLRTDSGDEVIVSVNPCRKPVGSERHVAERRLEVAGMDGRRQEVHRRRPDETRHEEVVRALVQVLRRSHLLEHAVAQDRQPVAEGHRLDLVVSHVDRRRVELVLQPRDLGAHLCTQLRIEVGERFVEEVCVGVANDSTTHRDSLALSAREVRRLALEKVCQLEGGGNLLDAPTHLVVRDVPQPQRERDVLVDRQMRVERVVLEHHPEVPVPGGLFVHAFAADVEVSLRDVEQADDHVQQRRLSGARRTDENHEFAVGNFEADVVDRGVVLAVALRQVLN